MILAGNAGVIGNAIREIFGLLDKAVYWVLVNIVNLLTDIARTNVLTESTIQTFANRIYFIMGTIMFFKMAVSIITYIVDPDKLTDSKTGFASIIKNTVIALVMVVAVPIVFRYAMFAQEAILQDDTIGRLITGKTGGTQNNVGDTVATNILSGFIHPDEDIVGGECNNLGYSEECKTKLATYSADLALTYSYIDPTVRTSQGVPGSKYGYAHLIDLGTANDVHKTGGAKDYVIDYKIVLSTLAGGFAVYIFLLSCFDVAVRTVKFAFLQIIAPIPIATYIDEKGKTMFNNWRKACVSTYVDLFVRLAAVQFGIFMITEFVGDLTNHGICSTQIQNGQIITGACRRPGIFVELFIIFGILLFIKEVPKLVEQITGIKLDGKFEMNAFKKMASVPLVGGLGAAGMQLAGNTALAGGRMLTSGFRGVRKGIGSAIHGQGFGAGFANSWNADVGRAAARIRSGAVAAGGTWSNWRGDGKYESGGAKYKSMMHGKDATSAVLGKQLYDRFGDLSKTDYASRYTGLLNNKKMAEVAGNLDAAKDRRNALQSDYEKMALDFKNGVGNLTAAQVDDARVAATKASSDYDKISAEFTRLKSENAKDAEKYDAYMKYSDAKQAQERVSGFNKDEGRYTTQSSSQASSTTSQTTSTSSQTVGGVNVTGPANGERTTDSGLIIQGSVRNDK